MTSTLSPPSTTPAMLDLRGAVVGSDLQVPVLDGRWVPHVNLDNAASTPAFRAVSDSVQQFLPFSSGVHRGNGYRSRISTELFENARTRIAEFVGADRARDVVVFGKNTTEALNTLARTVALRPDAIVLTTVLEHHSNDLPWRARAHTVHVKARSDGTLDEAHLDHLLAAPRRPDRSARGDRHVQRHRGGATDSSLGREGACRWRPHRRGCRAARAPPSDRHAYA